MCGRTESVTSLASAAAVRSIAGLFGAFGGSKHMRPVTGIYRIFSFNLSVLLWNLG